MIAREFTKNVLLSLADDHRYEANLRKQIELLTGFDYSYTGAGLIVTFTHQPGIRDWPIESILVLNDVEVRSSELDRGADANLFFDDGIISYLELFSKSGVYPDRQLADYELVQVWKNY
jgi:hypothetical protein